MNGESDLALGGRHNAFFLQICGSPVADAITDHIHGHIADGNHPQQFVLEHIVHKQGLEGKFFTGRSLGLDAAVVVSPIAHRRQTARFGGITDRPPAEDCDEHRGHGRENEIASPGLNDTQISRQSHTGNRQETQREAADRVGHVPYAHLETPFVLAEPVRHDAAAGRPAESAQPTHDQHQHKNDGGIHHGVGTKRNNTHRQHHQRRQHQTDAKEFAGVGTVRDAAHHKFAERIGDGNGRHRQTDLSGIQDAILDHIGSCQGEIFPNQIIGGVTQECSQEHLQPHGFIFLVNLLCR